MKRRMLLVPVLVLLAALFACRGANMGGQSSDEYEILAWNDLGMHCYDKDFSTFSILPPWNTLWAQVIKRGDKPELVTSGITVHYSFEGNTTSVGKSNFWQHAKALFGADLKPGVGLTGKVLTGTMDAHGDHFTAEGLPLTEVNDDGSVEHYQVAVITATDAGGKVLAKTRCVAPLSTEMHCANCHDDNLRDGIATGDYRTNILVLHDQMNKTDLMKRKPVLCGSCHSSNALGTKSTLISLSHAIHARHGFINSSLDGCYSCHPGKDTKCLRGVMFVKGKVCTDCHGGMKQVGDTSRNPWFQEPDCGMCHKTGAEPGKLYRMSAGHGGVYCAACHGSPHAEYPSALDKDNMQPMRIQGSPKPIGRCTACHLTPPQGSMIHVAGSM